MSLRKAYTRRFVNSRISKKERNLLKGAIRRVFSRSELRRAILAKSRIDHHDPTRPRVKNWSRCSACKEITPTYLIEIDHIIPVVRTNEAFENLSLDEFVDRLWCDDKNIDPICKACHNKKCKAELKERLKYKRERKNG